MTPTLTQTPPPAPEMGSERLTRQPKLQRQGSADPDEKRQYEPFPICVVCGERLGKNGHWLATAVILGHQVHAPECFREAEKVAQTALKARWPGFRVWADQPVVSHPAFIVQRREPEYGGLFAAHGEAQKALAL